MTDWGKTQIKAHIEGFKAALIDAEIEEVETPTGRKEVEIAWTGDGFHVEEGVAIGVYRNGAVVHVDWEDERERTTVKKENIDYLDESDWFYRND